MNDPINSESQRIARQLLRPGESLLWTGQPAPLRIVRQTLPILIFAVPWTTLALYWLVSIWDVRRPEFDQTSYLRFLPFLPFLLIVATLLAIPYWAYRRAGRTVYAVTDQRCLIITANRLNYVESFTREDIERIRRVERAQGTGDLIFIPSAAYAAQDLTRVKTTGFYGISQVGMVEEIIQGVFKSTGKEPHDPENPP
jgi:hypothetical protein